MAESKVGWGEEFLTLKHQYRVYIIPFEFSYLSFVDRLNLQKVPQSQEGLFLKASHSQLFYVNHYIVGVLPFCVVYVHLYVLLLWSGWSKACFFADFSKHTFESFARYSETG